MTHEFPPSIGGQGLVVYEISKELAKRGHEVTVLTTDLVDNWTEGRRCSKKFERFDGFDVYRLGINFRFNRYMISSSFLKRLLKDRADLLHTHGYSFFHSDATALVSKIRQVPFVITSHAFYPAIYRFSKIVLGAYNSLVGPIVLHAASKCLAVTQYYAKIFEEFGVPKNKIEVIPNGIDYKGYDDLPDPSSIMEKYQIQGKLITFIGRLDDIKSPALIPLMKSLKGLLRDFPKLRLAIIGPDWGFLPRLKRVAKDLQIKDSVIFAGRVSEQEKLMFLSASSIGAVVSTNEALSIVLLEFMAACKPVVVSRVGGLPYVVEDGITGFLTDNNANQMETYLRELLSDQTLAKKIGENAKKLVKFRYDWSKIVDKLENVYMECQR